MDYPNTSTSKNKNKTNPKDHLPHITTKKKKNNHACIHSNSIEKYNGKNQKQKKEMLQEHKIYSRAEDSLLPFDPLKDQEITTDNVLFNHPLTKENRSLEKKGTHLPRKKR